MKNGILCEEKEFIMHLFDFHTHVSTVEDIEYYIDNEIYTLINCSTVDECELVYPYLKKSNYIKMSVGIGPGNFKEVSTLEPFFKYAHVIGEIGLDNVWSEKNLDDQRTCFIRQLDIAKELNKPVILHTKGMEEEIVCILKNYNLMKIVHWYSGSEEKLRKFNEQGCFFTLGVDYLSNVNSHNVLKVVKTANILSETDGLFSIEWVHNKEFSRSKIKEQLEESVEYISINHQITTSQYAKNSMEVWELLK